MAFLYKHLRIHQIFGANTDVGKTVLTTALVRASAAIKGRKVVYLKPVSTGPFEDADDEYVKRYTEQYNSVEAACLHRYGEPVSPHLAAQLQDEQNNGKVAIPTDALLMRSISKFIASYAKQRIKSDLYIETAGGVHSPTLSGTTQADAYRPLRLPTILIGDCRLGGISSTISSYESLIIRGYTIDAILLFRDNYYKNADYLTSYFSDKDKKVLVASFHQPPLKLKNPEENRISTEEYYKTLVSESDDVKNLIQYLDERHDQRLDELDSMPRRTLKSIWWPFVQHGLVKDTKDITVIDSAWGDFFSVYDKPGTHEGQSQIETSSLHLKVDGSSSWWTQTFGHSNAALAIAAARAAGRYGHVMFPQATHEPALRLAENILKDGPGRGWASRVFFSDDGSTGMEIALKMALRAYNVNLKNREGNDALDLNKRQFGVLGLKGSYHGDTIGAMNACDAGDGVYTCEWHESKGYWLDPPSVFIRKGRVIVSIPKYIADPGQGIHEELEGESLSWVYDIEKRLDTPLAKRYTEYIMNILNRLQDHPTRLAALVLEPLILGAGGMIFVDPLFQRILVDVVRNHKGSNNSKAKWVELPVIFDEVFVGLYRLGMQSCAPLLGVHPDIAVYAKTLTGGVVPLALTLATENIFNAFKSEKKSDALLHGHSYTAHAVGCEVANESLKMMEAVVSSDDWAVKRSSWKGVFKKQEDAANNPIVWSFWDPDFILKLSNLDNVASVMTLGTVLAVKVQDINGGYRSHSAQAALSSIAQRTSCDVNDDAYPVDPLSIHYRTLGDVGYFMTSLNTPRDVIRYIEKRILEALI